MGAWGMKPFENDSACDWVYDLQESGLKIIEDTFTWEKEEDDYLDSSFGTEIIAAAEVLYGIKNGPREGVPDEVLTEIRKYKSNQAEYLYTKCIKAIDRVTGEDSELFDLWEETGENFEVWLNDVKELKDGLLK